MGSKLNKQLTKLVKKCSNTRESYYTLLQRRGRNLPIKLCPCKRCGLPLAAHHVAPVCTKSMVECYRDSNNIGDRFYCKVCGHDWTIHKNYREPITKKGKAPNNDRNTTNSNNNMS